MHYSEVLLAIYLLLSILGLLLFVVNSIQERESRATLIGMVFSGLMLAFSAAFLALWRQGLLEGLRPLVYLLDAAITAGAAVVLLPLGRNPGALKGCAYYLTGEPLRVDERDSIFARVRSLRPGKQEYEQYYRMHPDIKKWDDDRRSMGGPLGTPGKIDQRNRSNISMLHVIYTFPLLLGRKDQVKPPPKGEPANISAKDLTLQVKGFARMMGADLVGITTLNPLWVYSHRGEIFYDNWEEWGREIEVKHRYAIVIATEMNRDMIMSRPHTPTTIESSRNYGLGAYITVHLAGFLADMGYEATANHFRHYEVNCVPLAVDAGLGEMGRNGLLITKEFGPRVRLAVVTTNAPLIPDRPVDLGMQHFCTYCKRCAEECPSQSIPGGEKTVVNNIQRWKLNGDTCNAWWCRIGTDCSICMAVCPWSHPNTLTHKLSKALAVRSSVVRRLLIWAEKLFYGDYKGKWYGPGWCDYRFEVK